MEHKIEFCGIKILLTTAADRHECQAWEWWDEADVVISIAARVAILKGTARQAN